MSNHMPGSRTHMPLSGSIWWMLASTQALESGGQQDSNNPGFCGRQKRVLYLTAQLRFLIACKTGFAVKGLNFNYCIGETISISMYTRYGMLI